MVQRDAVVLRHGPGAAQFHIAVENPRFMILKYIAVFFIDKIFSINSQRNWHFRIVHLGIEVVHCVDQLAVSIATR